MRIKDKINMNRDQLMENGPIVIGVLGDSVSHGSVAGGLMAHDTVYHNRLREKILAVRDYVPVTVINSGIGGTCADDALPRLPKLLAHKPDLMIVCFGLNDVNRELDVFLPALKTIFEESIAAGAETVFMTPNMLNTYVSDEVADSLKNYAAITAEMQNSGKMDMYMEKACQVARECGAKVCDCYGMWKELSKTQDTTLLLANRINHPTREMHELFADALFKCIFDQDITTTANDNDMYQG